MTDIVKLRKNSRGEFNVGVPKKIGEKIEKYGIEDFNVSFLVENGITFITYQGIRID